MISALQDSTLPEQETRMVHQVHRALEGAEDLLADLLDKGWIRELEIRGVTQYRVRLAPKRGRALPANLWQALSDKVESEEEERP